MALNKDEKANLRNRYPIFIEVGFVLTLVALILAFTVHFEKEETKVQVTQEQEVVQMEEIKQTKQQKEPPPPPKPPVPVEVPNDEQLETEELDLDATLDFDEPSQEQPPPPPPEDTGGNEEPEVFVTVEQMPTMKPNNTAGMKKLHGCIEYPEMAKRAGVEGRVTIRFVVDEKGNVQQPNVIGEGLGAGLDKEAIRCVKTLSFKPGKQRGKPVKVQFALPVNFQLN